MTDFDVYFADGTHQRVGPANGYALEGPLTTFYVSDRDRVVLDSWSVRLASFRTADLCRIERREPIVPAA